MRADLWIKIAAGIVFSVLTGLLLATASQRKLLPEAPDKVTYDWRTFFLAERAKEPRPDIALVLINEQSLTGYDYVTLERRLLAGLVKRIDEAGAKAIGLDIIFERRTEPKKDEELIEAIRSARAPVILGAVDARSEEDSRSLAFQEHFISKTGRAAGHIYFGSDRSSLSLTDQAVRYLLPPSEEPPHRPAFAQLLAESDGAKIKEPDTSFIYWRRPPSDGGAELFPTFFVPPHREEDGTPKGPILPESWLSALKDKIVIIGGAFRDRDLHLTPLTVATRQPIHGAEIHAQIVAQLRDGRSIHELPFRAEFLVAAFVTGLGILVAARFTLQSGGIISTAIAFVFLVATGALLFAETRYILPSASLFIAWAAGLFAGNRVDRAVADYWHPIRDKQLAGKG